jgi:hypothetical protein
MITTIVAGLVATISIYSSFAAGTPSTGTSMASTIGSASGLGNAAGSIAAGANSALNPSGNSFIVPPPGAIGAGVFVSARSSRS